MDRWRLANGLTMVVQSDPRLPLIASMVCYDTGARHDPPGRAGLAHACEHLAFDGPRRGAESAAARDGARSYAARIEQAGGTAQGVTLADRLCFSAVFPSGALDAVLDVEAERMARPCDPEDADALALQQRILAGELQQRSQNRLRAAAVEQAHRLLFPDPHPYHRPAAGELAGVAAITPADVRAFTAARLTPAHATLVLVGDVRADRAAALVERAFAGMPTALDVTDANRLEDMGSSSEAVQSAGSNTLDRENKGVSDLHTPRQRRVPAPVLATQAHLAWQVAGFGQTGWYAAALLVRAMSAGRSSPLARRLVDTGLARTVYGAVVTMRDASTLLLAAAAAPGVGSAQIEQGLSEAADRVLAEDLTAPILARARTKALSDHYFQVQSLERRADVCAALACHLDAPERIGREAEHYEAVSVEEIRALADRMRAAGTRVTLSLVPRAEAA